MVFKLDLGVSPDKNIESFLDHMTTVDKEFAELLRKLLPQLLPVPEGQSQRQSIRNGFNSQVAKYLDASSKATSK